jgi:hypothetical protein
MDAVKCTFVISCLSRALRYAEVLSTHIDNNDDNDDNYNNDRKRLTSSYRNLSHN